MTEESTPASLTVALGARSYDIYVGSQLLANCGVALKAALPLHHVFIITDQHVAKHYLPQLEKTLSDAGIIYEAIILEPGERTKSFAVLERVIDEIISHKPERKSTLIAFGGGVIGDLTGFAASILLRGVNFIQIPTTLLSQVDSSVGGKTGINTRAGKNLVGSFYQPRMVLADTSLLSSLPKREFLAGYAEVVKYGLISDLEFFHWLEENLDKIIAGDEEALKHAVLTSCQSKADIVERDETESGVRGLLNLGHTFGHALEAETGYSDELVHGEGVAVGMVLAFKLSALIGKCSQEDVAKVQSHLARVGLPTTLSDVRESWDVDRLIDHMYQDKKVSQGKLVFILAEGIGRSYIDKEVDVDKVRELLVEEIA